MSNSPGSVSLATLQERGSAVAPQPDQRVDFFTRNGFELAQRMAIALSNSTSVPAAFQAYNLKRWRDAKGDWQEDWIKNESSLGNWLVAIDVANSIGSSITSVVMNANIIEGRLSWSAQFVIGCINASRRFTPLRFETVNRGSIDATWYEKGSYNRAQGRYDKGPEHKVTLDNLECIAWALPYGFVMPPGVNTLTQARAAGLPIIESAPVSMKMAVEEGWYGKSGSKWQTELKHQMLMYRAGAFFGRIHAPDIVMGLGQTTEERVDVQTVDMDTAGNVTAVTQEKKRAAPPAPPADEVKPDAPATPAPPAAPVEQKSSGDEQASAEEETNPEPKPQPKLEQQMADVGMMTAAEIAKIHEREVAEAAADTPIGKQRPAARTPRARGGRME